MVTPAHRMEYTLEDYLALEASSSTKHEFLAGQIYGMAGGTPEHAALKSAVTGLLFPKLRGGPCRLYDADLRVRVMSSGLYTYPDLTVICGPAERDSVDKSSIVNPSVIVEVTSPSTQAYDRGDKFEHYKTIPTLREYLIVSHDERRLELWERSPQGTWEQTVTGNGEVAQLSAVGATLAVAELYEAAGL
jgi:Uma2 family endonuclease